MNLLTKLISYLQLRKSGISHKAAKKQFSLFKTTKVDWLGIALMLVFVIVYSASQALIELNETHAENKIKLKLAQAEIASKASAIDRTERVLVSALNGAYRENGKLITVCRINAAGVCK